MRGSFMSLVIHYWIGDVQDCQGVSASEMTCIVSSGALNSTHSLAYKNVQRHFLWQASTAAKSTNGGSHDIAVWPDLLVSERFPALWWIKTSEIDHFLRYETLGVAHSSCTLISIAGQELNFLQRVRNALKKLPASVTDFRTLPSFETSLDQTDISTLFSHVWCTIKKISRLCCIRLSCIGVFCKCYSSRPLGQL